MIETFNRRRTALGSALCLTALTALFACRAMDDGDSDRPPLGDERIALGLVVPSEDGAGFIHTPSGERFIAWGFN